MTREKRWTPGPWYCGPFTSYRDGQVHGYYIQSHHHLPVLAGTLNWPHNADANAHLIAAAPELVEALEAIYSHPNCRKEVEAQLGEDIWEPLRKAYGETEED